jgi:hypothetical protein
MLRTVEMHSQLFTIYVFIISSILEVLCLKLIFNICPHVMWSDFRSPLLLHSYLNSTNDYSPKWFVLIVIILCLIYVCKMRLQGFAFVSISPPPP